MKRIAGVAVLAATLGSAHAAAQFDDYSIMGNGAISCSEFARYYRTDAATTEHIFFAWAQGFMSGYTGNDPEGRMTCTPARQLTCCPRQISSSDFNMHCATFPRHLGRQIIRALLAHPYGVADTVELLAKY